MTTKLIDTTRGEELARDLTAAEIRRLKSAGVEIVYTEGEGSDGTGATEEGDDDEVIDSLRESDDPGAGDEPDPDPDTDPDGMDDTPRSGGGGDELADDEDPEPESDPSGNGELDDLQDILDAMDEQADEDASGDWWDTDDYDTLSDIEQERWEQLQELLEAEKDDLTQDIRDRDQRIDEAWGFYRSEQIRKNIHNSDIVHELTEAFRELKTRDRDLPAESGQSLNMPAIVRQRAGAFNERNLYMHRERAESGDRSVMVSIDLSGSMDEYDVKFALAALAEVADIIGDDLAAAGWRNPMSRNKHYSLPLITAPGEKFEDAHLDSFGTGGGTPTASGIREAISLSERMTKEEKIIIVVTDGAANEPLEDDKYGDPMKHAAEMVEMAKEKGIKIIGLGVGYIEDEDMQEMFGSDYVKAEMDELATALVDIYKRQMNTVDDEWW